MLHEQIIAKLDQVSQVFRVLIIKTDLTIPYTTVFFELGCAYWPADAEDGCARRWLHPGNSAAGNRVIMKWNLRTQH